MPESGTPRTLWGWIHAAFHRPETRINQIVESVVWILIVLSIALLAIEPFIDGNSAALRLVHNIDRVLLTLFALEVTGRIASYHPRELDVFDQPPLGRLRTHAIARLRFAWTPMILVDIITVLALVPALRGLRVLRLLRLFRTARFFRYANPFEGLVHAFEADRLLFAFAFTVLAVEAILGGTTLFLVERGQNPGLTSLGDGLWWALVTITTVGFGDITPATALGRGVGGVLMVGGMFTLAMFAGIVGHSLLNAVLSIREEQFRMGDYVDHIVVCGYEQGDAVLIDTLRDELEIGKTRIVFFGDSVRPKDLPPDYLWVSGEPTKESELPKVRITRCSTVIIVGERTHKPQNADARSILTAFTIRSFMRKHRASAQRRKPIYIVAEILDPENVEHAKAAGVDEVIQTRHIGYSMLVHSISYPGTADAASRVVFASDQNLYVGGVPPDIALPAAFEEVSNQVRERTGAMVIGLLDPTTNEESINPNSLRSVQPTDRLLYIASEPRL